MAYRVAAKTTFTDAYNAMTEDEQLGEQAAAYEIVAKNGGVIDFQVVLWSDQELLTVATYPTQEACAIAELQIIQRGAFDLKSQPAYTIEEIVTLQEKAKSAAVVAV